MSQKSEYRKWNYKVHPTQFGCKTCRKTGRYAPFCRWCGSTSHRDESCPEHRS